MDKKQIIGRVEHVSLPGLGVHDVRARVDTGARTSALSARAMPLTDGRLEVYLLFGDTKTPHYFTDYELTAVASSNGAIEQRYMIRTSVRLGGKRIRSRFTLTDRTSQVYPILLGRNILNKKFLVDVASGNPDYEKQKQRIAELKQSIERSGQ